MSCAALEGQELDAERGVVALLLAERYPKRIFHFNASLLEVDEN